MKIKRTIHLFLSIMLIIGLRARAVQSTGPTPPQLPGILLRVDTLLDSNATAYQDCLETTAADCSLRGAISRANAEPGMIFTILLSPGTYHLSLPGEEDGNQPLAGGFPIHSWLAGVS